MMQSTLAPVLVEGSIESPVQQDSMSGESPGIVAAYEAHLDMRQMISVFAEMRGDGVAKSVMERLTGVLKCIARTVLFWLKIFTTTPTVGR